MKSSAGANLGKVLFFLGLGVMSLGVVFFLAQYFENWDEVLELFIKLGLGVTFVAIGMRSERQKPGNSAASTWLIFGIPLLVWGISTFARLVFGHHGDVGTLLVLLFETGVCYAIYLLVRRNVPLFYLTLMGSSALLYASTVLTDHVATFAVWKGEHSYQWMEYQALAIGVLWGICAYWYSQGVGKKLSGFFYAMGGVLSLGSMLALAQYNGIVGNMWEVTGMLASCGVLWLAVVLQRNVLLWVGGMGVFCNLFNITYTHFMKDKEWSLILIVCGVLLMFSGWLTLHLRKKYFN